MAEAPFDAQQAHRWFAVELNNLAWDLLESSQRTADDAERMVHAAHAACYHWLQVGAGLHHQRAQCLLATVYTAVGHGEAAVRHARRCLDLSGENGDEQSGFDRATAYGCAAGAFACAGQTEQADEYDRRARQAAAALSDADERQVVEQLYLKR